MDHIFKFDMEEMRMSFLLITNIALLIVINNNFWILIPHSFHMFWLFLLFDME